jgi:hypothetical protein
MIAIKEKIGDGTMLAEVFFHAFFIEQGREA